MKLTTISHEETTGDDRKQSASFPVVKGTTINHIFMPGDDRNKRARFCVVRITTEGDQNITGDDVKQVSAVFCGETHDNQPRRNDR
jgi:hypothetical protein